MRFLLFQTTLERVEESFHDSINAGYPLGLAYIHSYASSEGHVGRSFNLTEVPIGDCRSFVLEQIDDLKPDLIGFQVLSSNRVSTLEIVELLGKTHQRLPVVVGGIHASVRFAEMLAQRPGLTVITGEAEAAFSHMLNNLRDERPLYFEVSGIAYTDKGKLVRVPAPLEHVDLDRLPFPAHEQFLTEDSIYASLITSRGCPFACSFCSVSRRTMRMRSVSNVVDEIEVISARFPQVEAIRIWDDQFFFDNDRVIAICDEIVRRGIKMRFICLGRLKPCSRELVLALERAGFVHVLFGLETGSRSVSLKSNKKIKSDWALETASLFADSRINISMFLIVGLEGETADTILETARFVQKIQAIKYFPCWWNVGIATVYPDTDLFAAAKQKGMMTEGFWETDSDVPLFTAENSFQQLMSWKDELTEYIDPLRILESRAAFNAQRHLLPSIILWVLRNFGSSGDPYVNDTLLLPLLDVLAKVVSSPTAGIQLRIDHSLFSRNGSEGEVFLIERAAGTEDVFTAKSYRAAGKRLFSGWLLAACRQGDGTVLAKLSAAVDAYLAARFEEARHIEITDERTSHDLVC
ncbi:hypothetical protein N182_36445 [Sinorhizobium sp. GL2]|nr:hypothetical protein N182_36445 [Sinorhizobium sp. GL2]